MSLFDLFKKKKNNSPSEKVTSYKRHWLSEVATIELPEGWEVSYIDRFQAKSPDGKSTLTIITYKNQESTSVNQLFFEDLKLDFYQEYETEGFSPLDETFITDTFIGKSFSGEGEVQYHLTSAKNENNGILVTEFLLRSQTEFNEDMRDFLHRVGQSLSYISDFSQMFIDQMKAINPEVEIISTEGMEIKWKIKDSENEEVIFLDNVYAEYMHRPSKLEEILDKHANSILISEEDIQENSENTSQISITLENILPVVKNILFIENVKETTTSPIFYENLNTELVVVYSVTDGDTTHYLTEADVNQLGLSNENLRALTLENLIQKVEVSLEEEGSHYQLIADGNLESSFLLIPDVWTKQNFPVNGNIVIAIPTRDTLIVVDSLNEQDITFARQKIEENFVEGNLVISDKLFEFKEGEFVVATF